MDLTALLDELTYRVLASADSGADARARLAVITHWAAEQDARLAAGRRTLRLDSAQMVAEALARPCNCGPENYFGPCPDASNSARHIALDGHSRGNSEWGAARLTAKPHRTIPAGSSRGKGDRILEPLSGHPIRDRVAGGSGLDRGKP